MFACVHVCAFCVDTCVCVAPLALHSIAICCWRNSSWQEVTCNAVAMATCGKKAERIYKNQCFVCPLFSIKVATGKISLCYPRVCLCCVHNAVQWCECVRCVCVRLTVQSAVATSSCARWETLSLCTWNRYINSLLPANMQCQLSAVILLTFLFPKATVTHTTLY